MVKIVPSRIRPRRRIPPTRPPRPKTPSMRDEVDYPTLNLVRLTGRFAGSVPAVLF